MATELELVASEWEVCGEGARNIVLRYTGSQAPLAGRVLRVPKRATGRPDVCSDAAHARLERQLWEHLPEYTRAAHDAHKSWLFAAHVLLPLLGERDAAAGTLVVLPAESARALSCVAAGGVAVDTDEDGRCVCVLLTDHSRFPWQPSSFALPVVTVELKPKCGFLPEVLSAQHCAKRFVTRFEMHQRLKLNRGQVPKLSRYCPLDLFSHEPERMVAALRALINVPQNNFTVRVGGKLVFGGAGCFGKAPQDDVEQLSIALEQFFRGCAACCERVEVLLRLVIAALLQQDALRRLLAVQKLDTHDVEVAYQAYEALLKDADGADAETGDQPLSCLGTMPSGRALAVLRDFLIAQSAKDCAIMVALQPLPVSTADAGADDLLVVDAATNLTCRYQAAFVDLDVKRVTKMPHYLALERAVVAHFEAHTTAASCSRPC